MRLAALWLFVALAVGVAITAVALDDGLPHTSITPITECELDDAAEGVCTRGTP